ncbi:MAG: [FeFe] hydrogenase H-cluster maturation GTPase HydF [Lachnospiraceae bacterium]|nr:[FeFe] hydrogenase H-cluster maturation GTPase HydF [Lachnospiraceae bacterium]
MGLNATPSSERVHVSFFGKRNAGKSCLVNRVTGQELSVVSHIAGTTTDPVKKAMEILPIGPVLITDTPGFDDDGELGEKRVETTLRTLRSTDVAVLVIDAENFEGEIAGSDLKLVQMFEDKGIPFVIAFNKFDLLSEEKYKELNSRVLGSENEILVSAKNSDNIYELRELIGKICDVKKDMPIVRDLISAGDYVVLVVPLDSAAPKGRLILPQQQTLRDVLDANARAIIIKETELKNTLEDIKVKPALVITDSQVFDEVASVTPEDIPLTSFSILMARYKGFLDQAIDGAKKLSELKDGDVILIAEGCTHHRQCDDIGTVKIPALIKKFTGLDLKFEFTSGGSFPKKLTGYNLIIHCGGCMLNEREVHGRMKKAIQKSVPVTNYGIAIAYMKGILERSLKVL